ncbi:MAG: cellulase family glycosylhydrolase, partial [Lachnospiraceae bacterium]|nr:cellulase family glycosylhydrolase [Lachnospiraceae bacterium]
GVSTHGITWYPDFVSQDLFSQLSEEWDCDVVRLAVYSDEYANGHRDESLSIVYRGIDAAIASDMYVIVDWHVLDEHDPNVYLTQAEDFFSTVCSKYPDTPNIIFEICNEPNGETTWTDIKKYAEQIIPVIRSACPDSVVLVGTPNYDKTLTSAARSPLYYDNIMYVLHFYAGTHKEDLRHELIVALANGLPIFVSECGLTDSSGDGEIDYGSSVEWFNLLLDNDISFTIWSFSNKDESSAITRPEYNPEDPLEDRDLSSCGAWVKPLIQGRDPEDIPIPAQVLEPKGIVHFLTRTLKSGDLTSVKSWPLMALYVAGGLVLFLLLLLIYGIYERKHYNTYDRINKGNSGISSGKDGVGIRVRQAVLVISMFFTILYLVWRIAFSIPKDLGILPIAGNVMLLVVEILGFVESLILYDNLMNMKKHPLPQIDDGEYPDVDIFIATYNEPEELLRKTINGCNHLIYPDKSKVHVWLCDDNRRPAMRRLAEKMGIGYFDRPDNKGAKAGNLNHAMANTSAPYIVTLDADMIPMSHFLMNTIPYFVDASKRSAKLGLLQTPQCFYDPDVFQYALYSENKAPNEQDFFYRTIEVAKTSTNTVIYGGSNTVIAREALDAVGGFYTGSITEDFATGMLIEAAGFVSLALPEPMASGITPHTYKEHIQQRKRWGRGVISTARQLKLFRRKGLSLMQKLSYWSSVIYWYSPVKNLIYLISPLLFAAFAIPVFKCTWLDLVLFWLPMYIMQDITLRVFSKNAVSLKWSGIYEMSVMPHLLIPIIKETFGITASVFEVTDKSAKKGRRRMEPGVVMPFIILIALSVFGIVRSLYVLSQTMALGIIVLLFWLVRNLYYLIMAVFLVDGRDSDSEAVKVIDAEPVTLKKPDIEAVASYGVTTLMTEHSVRVFI